MKSVVLAVVLTGLLSGTALAGNIPTNDAVAPGNIPTSDGVAPGQMATNDVVASTSSVALTNVILTIITLINR